MTLPMQYVRLTRNHNRADFDCGVESRNKFLKTVAREEAERGLGMTYIATPDGKRTAGYYTLCSFSIAGGVFPPASKQSPSRPIPVILLGKLAADKSMQGQRFGELLLFQALYDCQQVAEKVGAYAVVVDALETAVGFYTKYGFLPLTDDEHHLFLTLKTIRQFNLKPQEQEG